MALPAEQTGQTDAEFFQQIKRDYSAGSALDVYIEAFPEEAELFKSHISNYGVDRAYDILYESLVVPAGMGDLRAVDRRPAIVPPDVTQRRAIEAGARVAGQVAMQHQQFVAERERRETLEQLEAERLAARPKRRPGPVWVAEPRMLTPEDIDNLDQILAETPSDPTAPWEVYLRGRLENAFYPQEGIDHIVKMTAAGFLPLPKPDEPMPEFESEWRPRDTLSGMKVFGRGLLLLPKQAAASLVTALQGHSGADVVDRGAGRRVVESAHRSLSKFAEQARRQYKNKKFLPGIKITDVAMLPQNLAFSGTSLGAGLVVGVPTALIPVPGARGAAFVTGGVAAGTAAFNMAAYNITQEFLEVKDAEMMAAKGRHITKAEQEKLKDEFRGAAIKHGLWEAIPEALSSAGGVGIALSKPLGKIGQVFGRNVATRILAKVTTIYGGELLTETVTELGQLGVREQAGLPGGQQIDWLSPTDWLNALKAVAPQTFLLTSVLGGAGAGAVEVKRALSVLEAEIGKDHPLFNPLADKISETEAEVEEGEIAPIEPAPEIEAVPVEEPAPVEPTPPVVPEEPVSLLPPLSEATKAADNLIRVSGEPGLLPELTGKPYEVNAFRAIIPSAAPTRTSVHYALMRHMAQPELGADQRLSLDDFDVQKRLVRLENPLAVHGVQGDLLDIWAAQGDEEAAALVAEASKEGRPPPGWYQRADDYIAFKAGQMGHDGVIYAAGNRSEVAVFPRVEGPVAPPVVPEPRVPTPDDFDLTIEEMQTIGEVFGTKVELGTVPMGEVRLTGGIRMADTPLTIPSVFAHEIGHVIFRKLPADLWEPWTSTYALEQAKGNLDEALPSQRARANNVEGFAEIFAHHLGGGEIPSQLQVQFNAIMETLTPEQKTVVDTLSQRVMQESAWRKSVEPLVAERAVEEAKIPVEQPPPGAVQQESQKSEQQFIDESPPIGMSVRQVVPENVEIIKPDKDLVGLRSLIRWFEPVRTIATIAGIDPIAARIARSGRETMTGLGNETLHYNDRIDAAFKGLNKDETKELIGFLEQKDRPADMPPKLDQAYDAVDSIRKEFFEMIRDEMGIDVEKWGMTPEEYWPHIFVGHYQIRVQKAGAEGKPAWRTIEGGFARNIREAVDKASAYLEQFPDDNIQIAPRGFDADYSTTMLSRKRFFAFIGEVAKATELDKSEILSMMKGVAAIKPRGKFAGNLLQRDVNLGGYMEDPVALKIYASRILRKKWLDPFRKSATDLANGLPPALRDYFLDYIDDVSGKYDPYDRNFVVSRTLSRITRAQAILKLGFRPITALVNRFQPMQLAFPEIGHYLFRGWHFKHTAEGKQIIEESGVRGQVPKFAATEPVIKAGRRVAKYHPLKLFAISEMANREDVIAGGYLYARKIFTMPREQADRRGLGYIYDYLDAYPDERTAALEYAKDLNMMVNFIYSPADLPKVFRGKVGRAALQFKTFPVNFTATTLKWLLQNPNNPHYWARATRLVGTNVLLGGVRTIPYVGRGIWWKLVGASLLIPFMSEDNRNRAKRVLGRGLFTLLGVDLSQRLGPNEFLPRTTRELLGPFASDLYNFYRYVRGDTDWKTLLRTTPLLKDMYTALAETEHIADPNRRMRMILETTKWDKALQVAGIPLEKVMVERDLVAITAQMEKDYARDKGKYVDRIISDITSDKIRDTTDPETANRLIVAAVRAGRLEAAENGILVTQADVVAEMGRKNMPRVLRELKSSTKVLRPEIMERLIQLDKIHNLFPKAVSKKKK